MCSQLSCASRKYGQPEREKRFARGRGACGSTPPRSASAPGRDQPRRGGQVHAQSEELKLYGGAGSTRACICDDASGVRGLAQERYWTARADQPEHHSDVLTPSHV
eukprot:28224-Chlamydomonas_euryale.AAC.7